MRLAVAVLQDTTQIAHWRTVAWYLGELGYPQCFEPLRDFVWANHGHGDSAHYMLDAITSAQTSIGFIAASNPAALDYLIQSTNPSFWKELPWGDPRRTAHEMRLAMSEASIKGLGLSGAPKAGQMLWRLRRWPYAEAQLAAIEDALRKFRHVSLVRRYSPGDLRSFSHFHLPELLPEPADSTLIYGTWRWMRSSGGGNYVAPPVCGWSRTLVLERDGLYSFWEEDSVSTYRISGGRFVVHTTSMGSWVEFEDWERDEPKIYWPRVMGSELLALRPGGSRWSFYRGLGPEGYEYTHYQIPSAVIGDFDGDSLADAAILGYDDGKKNVVTCLLSNRGAPRAVVAWTERGSGTKDGPTRPLHYLKLYPSGRSYVDSRGKRTVLATDAVWIVGKEGRSSILSYGDSLFRQTTLERSRRGRY